SPLPLHAALPLFFLIYWVDASSGGLIVLVQGAIFTAVYLLAPRYGILPRLLIASRRRSLADAPADDRTGTVGTTDEAGAVDDVGAAAGTGRAGAAGPRDGAQAPSAPPG